MYAHVVSSITRNHLILIGAAVALSVAGCECSGDSPADPTGQVCDVEMPPEGCGSECGPGMPDCRAGMYCSTDGVCTADCTPGGAVTCPSGQRCTAWGRCVDDPSSRMDASNVCAEVRVEGRPVTPTVILIVDQSGSMTARFGDDDRWNALRDFLMDTPDGFIASLEDQVEFGLAMYSAISDDDGNPVDPDMCPAVEYVPPALNNYDAIDAVYAPADPLDDTPTGDSIMWVLDRWRSIPDPDPDPTIFILATDGEPDRCEELDPQTDEARDEAVAAVEETYTEGIRTFVISVGDEVGRDHLQDVANAGLGRGPGDDDAPFWVAGDADGLETALRDIVGGVLSCEVNLEGSIEDTEEACASGTVRLNGETVPCDDENGWSVVDDDTIRLNGEACDELQAGTGATLDATFPCGVIAPF